MRVIIATGTDRYADPWHPFAATSQRVAEFLGRDRVVDVRVDDDVDHAMTQAASFDLVIVNAGDPWRRDGRSMAGKIIEPAPEAAIRGMADAIAAGTGFLALHAAVAALRDYPQWAVLTGAIWLPDVSWHPPRTELAISQVGSPESRSTPAASEFRVTDELYLQMQPVGDRNVIAEGSHEGVRHPVAWTRSVGRTRVAVDVLGHGPESYDAEGHRQLVTQLAHWAARRPAAAADPG